MAQSLEQKIVEKAHPDVVESVKTFKEEQALTRLTTDQLTAGAALPHHSEEGH